MVHRYIVTGAPGSGKTTVVDALASKGFVVISEAAPDVIAAAACSRRCERAHL
jgi:predicted ATPase